MTAELTETEVLACQRNLILGRVSTGQLGELGRHLVPASLPLGMRLGTPGTQQRYAYFPVYGLVSTDALTQSGDSVEVGVIGREGFSGLAGLLGQPQMPHAILVQAAGSGFRLPLPVLREHFLRGGVLTELVHQFIYLQMVQMAQSALCNRLHLLEARLARWMLVSSDHAGTNQLNLTQEFLAQMLGSRRSTVTVVAGNLQAAGIISYVRGRVTILDRPRLEAVSCECYGLIKAVYQRVLGPH